MPSPGSPTSITARRVGSPPRWLLLWLAGLGLLLAGGCKKASVDPPPVPFEATFQTEGALLAPPPLSKLRVTGTGTASLMGLATFLAFPSRDSSGPPPFPASGPATITAVAAPTDQLFLTFAGTSSAPDAQGVSTITLEYTVTGGAGRFARARGTLQGLSTATSKSPRGTASMQGTITY